MTMETRHPRRQNTKKEGSETSKKRKVPRACQQKSNEHLSQRHKTLRLPLKMDVGGRRSKCTFFNLKIEEKNALRCARSKFSTGRMTILATARHRVCVRVCVYIYIYIFIYLFKKVMIIVITIMIVIDMPCEDLRELGSGIAPP